MALSPIQGRAAPLLDRSGSRTSQTVLVRIIACCNSQLHSKKRNLCIAFPRPAGGLQTVGFNRRHVLCLNLIEILFSLVRWFVGWFVCWLAGWIIIIVIIIIIIVIVIIIIIIIIVAIMTTEDWELFNKLGATSASISNAADLITQLVTNETAR